MKKFIMSEKGNVLAFTAIFMLVLVGFMSLGIDVGTMMIARNQLQTAADAAALAGASGLNISQGLATARAIQFAADNTCMNQSVQISAADVTFPTTSRIRVQANQTINLNFAGVIGIPTANISAVAVAEIGTIIDTNGIKPWALPDQNWELGELDTIKAGDLGAAGTNPGFFYPIDLPPLYPPDQGAPETGAQEYEDNIINGSDCSVGIGDILQVEPGNMIGPTQQGVDEVINQDPGAYWDGSGIVGSNYEGFSSPRIAIIPLYDPLLPPDSGRNTITVTALAAFFISGVQGRNVMGYFLTIIDSGTQGNGNSMVKGVKLVQ